MIYHPHYMLEANEVAVIKSLKTEVAKADAIEGAEMAVQDYREHGSEDKLRLDVSRVLDAAKAKDARLCAPAAHK